MPNWNKLQSIYAALDNYQYTKAIKLCLQQPPTNGLARVLLAHALIKSGQRYKSLQVVAALLGQELEYFPELQLELQYAPTQDDLEQAAAAVAASPTPLASPAKKGKAKGSKKKTAVLSAANPLTPAPEVVLAAAIPTLDWIDRLDHPPRLPDNWDRLPPTALSSATTDWLHDEHILSTLAMLLHKHLRLPLTAFTLYRWAVASAATGPVGTLLLAKAYLSGLPVLVAPQYSKRSVSSCNDDSSQSAVQITRTVLQHMQALAMQLARQCGRNESAAAGVAIVNGTSDNEYEPLAILWAAQACLWQVDLVEERSSGGSGEGDTATTAVNPMFRLAESLAARGLDSLAVATATTSKENSDFLLQSEYFMLYLEMLDRQGKHNEKLEAIVQRLAGTNDDDDQLVYPPRRTLLDLQAQTLQAIGGYTQAMDILASQLELYPDSWSFWTRHAECSAKTENGQSTEKLAQLILTKMESSSSGLLRGPRLIRVEVAYQQCHQQPQNSDHAEKLLDEIINYACKVAPRALCCYSDVKPYLEWIMTSQPQHATRLFNWLSTFRTPPASADDRERRKELRQYIAAVQISHKVLVQSGEALQKEHLPDWRELLTVWKDFQPYDVINVDDPKENRPADELVLLAVQKILWKDASDEALLVFAASVLEAGMMYSPYNASLKIAALRVYGSLHAGTRAYELYRNLSIKHIQCESCAYLILPILRANGMYEETINISKEVVRLQRVALNEAADYSARAMENGARSKADEFVRFQRRRINQSLTALEAKGLILDAAPMFGQTDSQWVPGAAHGIIGGEADFERVLQMITEAHDPLGAFSIFQTQGKTADYDVHMYSDNRDLEILLHEVLSRRDVASAKNIICDSIRRGHSHGLLIRAALSLAASKGPKKGKLSEPSDEGQKRCMSLLKAVEAIRSVCGLSLPVYDKLVEALACACRVMVGLNTGIFSDGEAMEKTMQGREATIVRILGEERMALEAATNDMKSMKSNRISTGSQLLSECIVPIFAIFQMNATLFELYGWGRRKRNTKQCAGAHADVAVALASLIGTVSQSVACLPKAYELPAELGDEAIPDIVCDSLRTETVLAIRRSQEITYDRITSLASGMSKVLASFDIQE